MNLDTFTVSAEDAAAKAAAYASNTKADAEELYGECQRAYAALAEGGELLHLSRAFQQAGLDDQGMPAIAIARADRSEVYCRWRSRERQATFDCSADERIGRWPGLRRTVDMGQEHHDRDALGWWKFREGYAMVPMVPADVRPAKGQLRDWWVLWDVEEWYESPRTMEAPRDPLLLEHIGGELYRVLAEWDLTEIERAILEGVRAR